MSPSLRVLILTGSVAASLVAAPASAQVSSSMQQIALGAIKGQTVTLGAPSPTSQGLNLVDGAITEWAVPFSLTVSWDVTNSPTTTVKLVGYFPTPSQALVYTTAYIPSSAIEASIDNGVTWSPVTSNAVGGVGSAGGSVVLYTSAPTDGGNKTGSASVTFKLRLNLTAGPTTVAGIYAGTFYLMAIAN